MTVRDLDVDIKEADFDYIVTDGMFQPTDVSFYYQKISRGQVNAVSVPTSDILADKWS